MLVLTAAASVVIGTRRRDTVRRGSFENFEKPRFGEIFLFRDYFGRNRFAGKSAFDKTGFAVSQEAYSLASEGRLFNLKFNKLF